MRKLVTDVCHVAVVKEQNTDFGEILSVPVNKPDKVPSKLDKCQSFDT